MWIASDSPRSSFGAVFEDDKKSGYFYAYDRAVSGDRVLDALLIYNAVDGADADHGSEVRITRSTDGLKAGLLIDDLLHAVIDFARRKAYCRTNVPLPSGSWTTSIREAWSEGLAGLLS